MQVKNRKTLGILLMLLPPIGLVTILIVWSLVAVLISIFVLKDGGAGLVFVANYVNIALGIIGLLCVMLIPIGFVVGLIILLQGSENKHNMNQSLEKIDNTIQNPNK